MSYMSWIAQMVSDNTYQEFKDLYIKAHENKQESFIFGSEKCDTVLGKHVCNYVDTYLMDHYDNHLIKQAELQNEYEKLITKGF